MRTILQVQKTKKELHDSCFPTNFEKFFITTLLQNTSRQLFSIGIFIHKKDQIISLRLKALTCWKYVVFKSSLQFFYRIGKLKLSEKPQENKCIAFLSLEKLLLEIWNYCISTECVK